MRTPADAASQIFDLYDMAIKGLIPAADAYYLSATLKNLADLRLTQAISDSVISEFERRLAQVEEAAELFR